jgi:hypothetical protein
MLRQSLIKGVSDRTISCSKIDETAFIIQGLSFGITHLGMTIAIQPPELTDEVVAFCKRALNPARQLKATH